MSDKALSPAALELTQRIQLFFPRDINPDVLRAWNGATSGIISTRLREVFGKAPEPAVSPVPVLEPLLIPLATITIPATPRFVAADRFKKDVSSKAEVKISYLGDNFKAWFLGKTEEPFGGSTLRYAKLSRPSVDGPIIAELAGEAKAETTLTELFALLKAQRNGEIGPLLVNGCANIFYIRGVNGVLRSVSAHWRGDGWGVYAGPVADPDGWGGGYQVFSRPPASRAGDSR